MREYEKLSLAMVNLERELAGLKPLKNYEESKVWSKKHFRRNSK